MKRLFLLAALAAAPAFAQDSIYRAGTAPMASEGGADRLGQPITLARPVQVDPFRATVTRFLSAYRKAGAPRVMILWNRTLTDDVDSERESYARFSGSAQSDSGSHAVRYATPWADNADAHTSTRSTTQGEIRSGERRVDTGLRASPNGEAVDFDTERGFSEAFGDGGVKLVDRTSAMRVGALRGMTGNVQALEMRAILDRSDLTLEVVPVSASDGDLSYNVVVRDVRSQRIIASLRSNGHSTPRRMPYVAGEHGFVRATPRDAEPYEIGRQVALDTMAVLAPRL